MRLGRVGRNEKIELLKHASLFSHCNKKQLGEIAKITDEIELPAGKNLIRQGERGREFFILLEGEVDILKDGKPVKKRGPGDIFGEIALVSNVPRTATVTSTTPVRVLVVTDRDFKHLLEQAPDIQLKVLEALAVRLAELQQLD